MQIKQKYQSVKTHVQENKKVYLAAAGGATLATITCVIVRRCSYSPISPGISGTADHGISVIGKRVGKQSTIQHSSNVLAQHSTNVLGKTQILNNVSYISQNRKGPPSWVVRCKETGALFTSQNKAAKEMGISSSNLSQHLNGLLSNADGYTFERICMAA